MSIIATLENCGPFFKKKYFQNSYIWHYSKRGGYLVTSPVKINQQVVKVLDFNSVVLKPMSNIVKKSMSYLHRFAVFYRSVILRHLWYLHLRNVCLPIIFSCTYNLNNSVVLFRCFTRATWRVVESITWRDWIVRVDILHVCALILTRVISIFIMQHALCLCNSLII